MLYGTHPVERLDGLGYLVRNVLLVAWIHLYTVVVYIDRVLTVPRIVTRPLWTTW